jgi:hypothetical protein
MTNSTFMTDMSDLLNRKQKVQECDATKAT